MVYSLLLPLLLSLASAACAKDATNKLFQWQFASSIISTQLPTCQELPIVVKSYNKDNSTHGKPPYYMTSFAIGGLPVTSLIGNNDTGLNWTIVQPVGSKLLLGVVDADGSSGGIPPRLFEVVAGQSTQCVQSPKENATFVVFANVTDQISTCDPWGIRVKGGVPPYTITLAQPNSPVVTNVTFAGPDDDAFTFIDRADTNSQIMAAISDFTGAWASGTVLVNTIGSPNVDCIGLVSSSGNSTQLGQDAKQRAGKREADKKQKKAIIIGVVVAIVVVILLSAGILVFFMRRRKTAHGILDIDAIPRCYDVQLQEEGHMPKSPSTSSPKSIHPNNSLPLSAGDYDPYHNDSLHLGYPARPHSGDRNRFATLPTLENPHRSKGAEAASRGRDYATTSWSDSQQASSSAGGTESEPGATTASPSSGNGERHQLPSLTNPDEIVIQHRDASEQPVVRELPPPYADRSLAGQRRLSVRNESRP